MSLADLGGRIDAVLDGGPTPVGLESTIVACLGGEPRLLRPGGVPREAIEAVLGRPLDGRRRTRPRRDPLAPGHARLALRAARASCGSTRRTSRPGEAVLLFGAPCRAGRERAAAALNLSATRRPRRGRRQPLRGICAGLDAAGAATIAVTPIPNEGLGEAINDRLRRAAAGR